MTTPDAAGVPANGAFTVAAVQAAPVFLDAAATVERAARLIQEAAANGARLVVFPETWLPGYPSWIYGTLGWDNKTAKRLYARLHRNAVTIPGPETQALGRAAKAAGVTVVIGVHERDTEYSTGTLFNSLLTFAGTGELLGAHRKLMPTHAERIVWGRGDGSTLHVYDTPLGRLGGLICWEHWMPLGRYAMHAKGEQIHVAVWPDVPDAHELASRHYAFEGRCWVICSGTYMTVEDLPPDIEAPESFARNRDGVILGGGSGIIGPDGRWSVGPIREAQDLVFGEIDLARIPEEQLAFDAVGHYNRPDVFQLTVDERPQRQVRWLTS